MSVGPVRITVAGVAIALGCVACTESSTPQDSTSAQDTVATEDTAATQTTMPEEVAAVVPSGPPLVEGLTRVNVLGPPEGGAGEVPQFRWEPVEGAATYDLVVLGPDGPLWAWSGEETEIRLGALPVERPQGMGGPVIVAGSCWSLVALGADGHAVAVSEFLPVSPAEPDGHVCVPGSGAAPTS